MRVTWIAAQGEVLYDNLLPATVPLENHARRPEILQAAREGKGSDVRTSASNSREYLYYAKQYDGYYIRMALPYDIHVRHFLKPGNGFLYYMLALFVTGILFIHYVAGREATLYDTEHREKTRRLKQELTGNVAHELRTPVTAIRGYLETILEQPLEPEKERRFLQKAYRQTLLLSELIRDMNLLTKLDETSGSFALKPVAVAGVIQNVASDLAALLEAQDVTVESSVPQSAWVYGNESLLYAVFRNLMENVARHAGKQVKILITQYAADNDFLHFSFADTGAGIDDPRHLPRLFERFYRVTEGRTRDTGGTGLGLAIVKNSILFHKGAITVKNRNGGGLQFLFSLPLSKK